MNPALRYDYQAREGEAMSHQEPIQPVKWWKNRPAFDVPEGSKLRALAGGLGLGLDRRGPFPIAELERIAADAAESSEARYVAMGYLVALHNEQQIESDALIDFLVGVARAALAPSQWFSRRNALDALVELRAEQRVHPRALAQVIALAGDPAFRKGQRDALAVLAHTGEPAALGALAAWLGELGASDAAHASDAAGAAAASSTAGAADPCDDTRDIWSAAWRDQARLFIQLLDASALRRDEIDAAAILRPLRAPGAAPRHLRQVGDFFIEAALAAAHDARMTGVLAELILACEGGDTDRAAQHLVRYQRDHRLAPVHLEPLRAQIGGAPPASALVTAARRLAAGLRPTSAPGPR